MHSLSICAQLSLDKFEAGMIGYFEVQLIKNDLFSAELTLASLRAQCLTQIVNVCQAMGGGWVELADARTPTPARSRGSRTRNGT